MEQEARYSLVLLINISSGAQMMRLLREEGERGEGKRETRKERKKRREERTGEERRAREERREPNIHTLTAKLTC